MNKISKPALPLSGYGLASLNLYQQALIENNEHLLHAIEVAARLWINRKTGVFIDTDESTDNTSVPEGWRLYHHHAFQKSTLVPLSAGPRAEEVKEIPCFVKCKGEWQAVMLRGSSDFSCNRYRAGRLFNFIHSLYGDIQSSNLQAFYEVEMLDSAETVLAVEPEVIDWILADSKKE